MRVLPPEQVYRPAAYAERSARRTHVADVIDGTVGAPPAPAASVGTLGRALVPCDSGIRLHRFATGFGQGSSAPWLAQAIGQFLSEENSAEPAIAAAAYERADAMSGLAIELIVPGARVSA